jgi:hypothetical protein
MNYVIQRISLVVLKERILYVRSSNQFIAKSRHLKRQVKLSRQKPSREYFLLNQLLGMQILTLMGSYDKLVKDIKYHTLT